MGRRLTEEITKPKQTMINTSVRMTVAAKEVMDDQEFLPTLTRLTGLKS
jgi:hypothetical protein